MPLKYYQEWSTHTAICIPHYDCISYIYNLKNELGFLYVFKIILKEKQSFTCQVCFHSYRVSRNKIDINDNISEIDYNINEDKKNIMFKNICGIKIIKNDENLKVIKNYCSKEKDYDYSSIKEINSLLEMGEYFIMIYPESPLNECIIRFLVDKNIEIKEIKKFDILQKNKNLLSQYTKEQINIINLINSTENIFEYLFDYGYYYNNNSQNYKVFLNSNGNNKIKIKCKKENYLPGIKRYYLHFKALAESKNLDPEDAIYSISQEGETTFYDILDNIALNKIYGEREKNGKIKSDIIDISTIQFIDNSGYPYKVKNFKELIHQMKINKEPINCLFSEYDENTSVISSGSTYLKLYHNKANNEDILVVTDKSGNYKKRQHNPLFIIILDISGSMSEFSEYLQHKVIPNLLIRLNYLGESKEFFNKLCELNISNLELLQAITSKYILENFLNIHGLKNKYNENKIKNFCDNIITLITFSDDSQLYFLNVLDFKKQVLSGGFTNFLGAANNLNTILNSVSKERSIRLLSFSDGEISDIDESMQILNSILNSNKTKHQMN